jgi:hypothetical protein
VESRSIRQRSAITRICPFHEFGASARQLGGNGVEQREHFAEDGRLAGVDQWRNRLRNKQLDWTASLEIERDALSGCQPQHKSVGSQSRRVCFEINRNAQDSEAQGIHRAGENIVEQDSGVTDIGRNCGAEVTMYQSTSWWREHVNRSFWQTPRVTVWERGP